MQTRGKLLAKNTVASLAFQITNIVCGFVLPRLILKQYGSNVNGLVNSITQFLGIIGFLEMGVGVVVQSSLYKPLAEKNDKGISEIIASAQKFFSRLALILCVYVVVLVAVYPIISKDNGFGWTYTVLLILAMSISFFSQFYFGVVDRLLLTADQRGYIQYNAQTVTLILNTLACAVLIKLGSSIHIVKLTTSCIYLLRPLYLRLYVNRRYSIDRKIKYSGEPIKQKWNGVAQHVASVVLDSTDTIVLTVFSTLSNVSIYSVYHLVIYGVKQLFVSMTNGIQSLLGELWARNDSDRVNSVFGWSEWAIHTGTVLVFGCTGVLILPFVSVYTAGINDAPYLQSTFAILITLAHACHCLRLPYNIMILACGHYKQTQNNYIIAAIMNLLISIATVRLWGLIGVAIGTLAAMLYQTIWMAIYCSDRLLGRSKKVFTKQFCVDAITCIVGICSTHWINMIEVSYKAWLLLAIETACIWLIVVAVINFIFYRDKMKQLVSKILKRA